MNEERIPPPVGLETRIPPPRRVNTRTGYLGICFRIPPPATCGGGILKQVPNHRCFSMPPPTTTKNGIEREYSQHKKLVSEIWKELAHKWTFELVFSESVFQILKDLGGGILKQVSKQPVSECPPKRSLKGFERQIKRPVSGTAENDKKLSLLVRLVRLVIIYF